MSLLLDRIRDTSASVGVGDFVPAGTPPATYFGFGIVPVDQVIDYVIAHQGAHEVEVGRGTVNGAGQIVRTDVLAGTSGAGVKVDFSAGTKDIFLTAAAASLVTYGANGVSTFGTTLVGSADAPAARAALDLAAVAGTGAYADLSGLPTLGTMAGEAAGDYALLAGAAFTGALSAAADLTVTGTARIGGAAFGKLGVRTGASGSAGPLSVADEFVIEHSDSAGMTILTPSNKVGYLLFGDESLNFAGKVAYVHSTDTLAISAVAAITLSGGDLVATLSTGSAEFVGTLSATGTVTAPTFSGDLTGNASGSAATLASPRLINGVAFDGSADITIPAAASGANSDITSLSGLTTPLSVPQGGTGAITAADARTALGLVIGTNVQAQDAELAAIASLTSAADRLPYFTGSGTAALATFPASGRAILNTAGTANTFPYFSATNTVSLGNASGGGLALVNITGTANTLPYFSATNVASSAALTAAGRNLLDDADASAQRTTLGLGTMATATAADYALLAGATFVGSVTAPTFVGALTGHASLDLPLTGGALSGAVTSSSTLSFGGAAFGTVGIAAGASGSAGPVATASMLVIENDASAGLSILTPSSSIGSIYFGDEALNSSGQIRYNHANDSLTFFAAGSLALTLGATGLVTADSLDLTSTLVVGNSAAIPSNTKAYIDRLGTSVLPTLTAGTVLTLAGSSAASNAAYFQLISGNTGLGALRFGDTDTAFRGSVTYDHSDDSLAFFTAGATRVTLNSGGVLKVTSGNFEVTTVGKGLRVKEGTNGKQDVATLVAGTVVVANTSVTATSRIFLTAQATAGTPGALGVSARVVGTSFTILSTNVADTSTVAYQIFEPA